MATDIITFLDFTGQTAGQTSQGYSTLGAQSIGVLVDNITAVGTSTLHIQWSGDGSTFFDSEAEDTFAIGTTSHAVNVAVKGPFVRAFIDITAGTHDMKVYGILLGRTK